ncbi:MAG: DUF2207 domain-containing protein [Candidatus Paceibacterota bacterium]|jgi:uncharacterized membrane protein
MKKTKITLWNILIFFGLFFVLSSSVHAEITHDFSATINVLPDSSILVKEKINYDFEKNIRHGIFRTIPLLNSKNEPIEVKVISVTNELDKPYQFTLDTSNKEIKIKIGDPQEMISGIKEYHIVYRVLGSISYYQDFDELYWNVTGNDWDIQIEKAEAKIILPNNVFPLQEACYSGKQGSKESCQIIESGYFTASSILNAKEGLTIAVGFPKGVVSVYQPKIESQITKIIKIFWPVVIPIVIFVFMFLRWLKNGRDPKGTGVIIPQYDVPDNLTPLEVGYIMKSQLRVRNISAEIIYLATKGYLKVRQIDCDQANFLCLISKKDYELTLLKERGLLENDFDRKIVTTLFGEKGKVGGVIKLSGLKKGFYKSIPHINDSVIDNLLSKKYYKNFPKFSKNIIGIIFAVLITGVFIIIDNSDSVSDFLRKNFSFDNIITIFIFVFSIIVSVIILMVFRRLMPAKSKKGVLTKEYLLGLKKYLEIAEKDRLNFHNAPDKKPEIFEKLLPYAMVFGVEELWAKEFKDIYVNPPEWYEGPLGGFSSVSFGHEMIMFNALASNSISTTPNGGSGSFGGGFSGGGGGGGGGGSW